MPIALCKKCQKINYDEAPKCPHCGETQPNGKVPVRKITTLSVIAVVLFSVVIASVYFPSATIENSNSQNASETPRKNEPVQMQGGIDGNPRPGTCIESPFKIFSLNVPLKSSASVKLMDKYCPGASYLPNNTNVVFWDGGTYEINNNRLPFDGMEARWEVISIRKLD